jgi:adenosylmethionine-8-amino-7-oxononanoate aminotransferase
VPRQAWCHQCPAILRIREICDQHGVLLILDEVMCGMGCTGHLFACEPEGISPDILTVAKGLGAGYQPIGAMLCQAHIYDTIGAGSGFFQQGHTYMGHTLAASASVAVLKAIQGRQLLANVRVMGDRLRSALKAAHSDGVDAPYGIVMCQGSVV